MKRKASFGVFDRPRASLKEDKSATIVNGRYTFPDGSSIASDRIKYRNDNPNKYYLKCEAYNDGIVRHHYDEEFEIVEGNGEQWDCRHYSCRDISCHEPHLGYYPESDDFRPLSKSEYWDYEDKKLKDLPLYHYYDGTSVSLLPYNAEKKNRCVRKWNGECQQYECRDCYNCDEKTGECKDNMFSKLMCQAKKAQYDKDKKWIQGCNYESFTEGYLTDDYVNRVNEKLFKK